MRSTTTTLLGVSTVLLALTGCSAGPSMDASPSSASPEATTAAWAPAHGTVNGPLSADKNSAPKKWTDKGPWSDTKAGAQAYTYYTNPETPDAGGMTAVLFPPQEKCEATGNDVNTTLSGIAFNTGIGEVHPGPLGSNAAKNGRGNQLVDFDGDTHLVGASEVGSTPVVATRAVQALKDKNGPGHTATVNAAVVRQPDGSYYTNSCSISYTNRLDKSETFDTGPWSEAVAETRELGQSVTMTKR